MDPQFWHRRWETREIGFHQGQANPLLVEHADRLPAPGGGRVFLPLCGKTRDIAWLLDRGHRVAGVELSERAIGELFEELGIEPETERTGRLVRYAAPGLDVFGGDLFDLSSDILGPVDAIYDRAALVALPDDMREHYTAHLVDLTRTAPQFLITFEYDQRGMEGPPFSIDPIEVEHHYADAYRIETVERRAVEGGLKGQVEATETLWRLHREVNGTDPT